MGDMGGVQAKVRRAVVSRVSFALILGLLALVIQNSAYRERTFLADWDKAMLDQLVQARRNTIAGHAPPMLVVDFNGPARDEYFAAHPPAGKANWDGQEYPQTTPLPVISATMANARRMNARAVVVDIDVASSISQRDPKEAADFTAFLTAWAADPASPFTVLVRTAQPTSEGEAGPTALVRTPWDAVVAKAPNLAWGGSGGQAGADGAVRYQFYYTCLPAADGRIAPLPSAPMLITLADWQGRSAGVRDAAAGALDRAKVCAQPEASSEAEGGKTESAPPGKGFSIAVGKRTFAVDSQRGLIDYHLDDPANGGASPVLPPGDWARGSRAVSVWTPGVVMDNLGPDVGQGSVVVLGSNHPSFPDVHWTPYGERAGDIILANCIRGLLLSGPIREIHLPAQLVGFVAMLLVIHFIYKTMTWLHGRVAATGLGVVGAAIRVATSAATAKLLALAMIYGASLVGGLLMLSLGYWQTTPFIGATIYIIIGDAVEFLEDVEPAEAKEAHAKA